MSQLRQNHMLVQPNLMIDADYDLNKHQTNIVMMGLGLLDTTAINRSGDAITFDIADLHKVSKSKLRKDRYIAIIKQSLKDIKNSPLSLVNPVTKDFREIPWLSELSGNLNTNKITLYFNQRVLDLFSEIKGDYTQCLLRNTMPLKTTYAKRLYQMVMQYKPPQKVSAIALGEFRSMLQLLDSYPDYNDLNRYVIIPAIKDINKQTDILLNARPVKTGKTVNALQFSYKFKSKNQADVYQPSTKRPVKRKAKKRSQRTLARPVENTNQSLRPAEKHVQAHLAKSGKKY